MLKIAVFDTGYGGELFADRLEQELPVVEVIRIIAWRNAKRIEEHPFTARKLTEESLRPYIGNVDLLVIANYQISATCLSYFRRKYPNQKFIGFSLNPERIVKRPTIILTTRSTTKNLTYFTVARRLKAKTICLDNWPLLIDDGELTDDNFKTDLEPALKHITIPKTCQIFLACGQFNDCIQKFRQIFGHNARIVDSFDHTIHETCHALGLRSLRKT